MICPNLSNPQLKQEINELKDTVGEALAYHLWNQNNGHHLDRAVNGNPSIFYENLVQLTGNKIDAFKVKSRIYTNQFKNWFGNSSAVDENGEPIISVVNDIPVITSESGEIKHLFQDGKFDPDVMTTFDRQVNIMNNRTELASSTDNLYEEWESIFPDFAYLNETEKQAAIELIEQGFFQITC